MKQALSRKGLSVALILCIAAGLFTVMPGTASAYGDSSSTVSSGYWHTLAVKADGSLWAWGSNYNGQLGDGGHGGEEYMFDEGIDRDSPVKIMDGVIAVSAGENYSMAIKSDGSLWAWGENVCGQLGDGTTADQSTPVKIMDDAVSVSAHTNHTAAVKADGSLWVWGENCYGQIGNGNQGGDGEYPGQSFNAGIDENRPVKITDGVAAVATGLISTMAVKADGSLWGWGGGNLGDGKVVVGQSNIQPYPVKVTDHVKSVCLGGSIEFIIKTDNSLWGWGGNYMGLMGNGTADFEAINTPVRIMDGVFAISADERFALAVKTDGSLWIWGHMLTGSLANDGALTDDEKTPKKVMDNVAAASAGVHRATVIKADRTLWTWGAGWLGELGDGDHAVPMPQGGDNFHANLTPAKIMDGMKLSVVEQPPPVADKPSSWAAEQVNAAITANLVPESLQSKYTQATTRAEFCALAVSLYENIRGEITGRKEFTDTTDINVQKCAYIGVVSGTNTEQTIFSPDTELTREQAATMLHRLATAMEYNIALTQEYILWTDEDSISEYARSAAQFVYKIGVMNGTGTNTLVFSPKAPYTREQSIATIMRLFDVLK